MPTVLAQSIASTDPNLEHVSKRLGRKPRLVCVVTISMSTKFFEGQLAYLAEHGFDVTMISSPGPELKTLAAEGIATCAIAMEREISLLRDLRSLWALWRSFRKLRPDIVNAGTPKAGLLGTIAGRLAGVPCVIYTLHGLRLETTSGWKRRILMTTESIACKLADAVFCVSRSLMQRVTELGIVRKDKTRVVGQGTTNGVDIASFTPTNQTERIAKQLRSALAIPAEARVVGFVGRFTRDKGVEELYRAFLGLKSDHPDLRLLMVGDFESGDPVRADLCAAISADPSVIRTGFIRDVAPYYAIMDVLAFPSYREGFPGVPLEAQAAEVPVVVSDATGAVDSVIEGVTGYVVPVGNPTELHSAIGRLLENSELRRQMGRAGRDWVMHSFQSEIVWRAILVSYTDLLGKGTTIKKRGWRQIVKSVFDRTAASVLLLLSFPLWALTALLIRCKLGRPVLFRQTRAGAQGVPFEVLKFRTMTNKIALDGSLASDEQRLTPFGRRLRSWSIDEIPQLWNVVKGQMSLVGPRPLLMRYLDRYTPEQARRHEVLPGITGWAQVNGRNTIGWGKKFEYDVWYVDHWSLSLDIRILFLTVSKVFCRHGISNPDHATMPEFMGDSYTPAFLSPSQEDDK